AFLLAVAMLGIPFQGTGWTQVLSGMVILFLLWLALRWKLKKEQKLVSMVTTRIKNTTLLCLLMLMIGYSSYALIVIRSSANPPMDQNSPEDIFTLGNYLSRDQYGDTPLLYGPAYNSQVALEVEGNMCRPKIKQGAPIYDRKEKVSPDEKDSYFVVDHKSQYVYAQNMLFPRMHSSDHAAAYESWMGGVDGYTVPYDRCGEPIMVKMPTQLENLRFFLSYQCNFMYWRYFMWNFAGRQNDIQGNGEPEHGNWITGISFIDNAMLGDQSKLPDDLKNNKGHNVFYCLPLLLGLIGLFWQAYHGKRGIQQFWVVFFLFFMTGLAIVLYLNQTPMQPRERDYAYAGSFYAFAIWCGLGVVALVDLLSRKLKRQTLAIPVAVAVIALLVPIQMVSQTWDDHDRSGRYICHDVGQNYLSSLQEGCNPIIFTNGDNDTFPLWYNQEVEGFGTDVRVCNLSYLRTDWYIDQMRRPAYDSPSVPISWPRLDYCSGTNEYVLVQPDLKEQVKELYREHPKEAAEQFGDEPFELKNILRYWVRAKDENMHVIPTDTVYVTIDKEAVKKSGMMMATDSIPDKMVISLKGKNALYKNDLMMLEIIAQSNWTRPIYVAMTVGSENYMNLGDNFVKEGMAYRITPFTTNAPGAKNFDAERTYHNVMNRFKFGNLKQPGLYIDETNMRSCHTLRQLMSELAIELIKEGKSDKALKVLHKAETEIPDYNVPICYVNGGVNMARAYTLLGQKEKAKEYLRKCFDYSSQYLEWYLSLSDNWFAQSTRDCLTEFYIMQAIQEVAAITDRQLGARYQKLMDNYYRRYTARGGQMPLE
ncbi:MAG TPA: tetratricopeptide repeat protein, partial [Candidatus Prevotella avicola]|nr:tetratricopeptide repeat protein [Candidatus Prevotella avicola]